MKLKKLLGIVPNKAQIKKDLRAAEKTLESAYKRVETLTEQFEALEGVVVHAGHPLYVEDDGEGRIIESAAEDVHRYAIVKARDDGFAVELFKDCSSSPRVEVVPTDKAAFKAAGDFVAGVKFAKKLPAPAKPEVEAA